MLGKTQGSGKGFGRVSQYRLLVVNICGKCCVMGDAASCFGLLVKEQQAAQVECAWQARAGRIIEQRWWSVVGWWSVQGTRAWLLLADKID